MEPLVMHHGEVVVPPPLPKAPEVGFWEIGSCGLCCRLWGRPQACSIGEGGLSGGKFPAFVSHLGVGPVLELLEQGRFDDGEAQADPAVVAHPH